MIPTVVRVAVNDDCGVVGGLGWPCFCHRWVNQRDRFVQASNEATGMVVNVVGLCDSVERFRGLKG